MSNYTLTLKIYDQLEEHASGKCQCDNPEECAAAMAGIIREGARALDLMYTAFTPAQVERAAGRMWEK